MMKGIREAEVSGLVEDHVSVVEELVRMVWGRLSEVERGFVEYGDLVGAGNLGLVQAAWRWDSGRGVKFRTYLGHRVVGEIRDEVRRTVRHLRHERPSGLMRPWERVAGAPGEGGYLGRVRSQLMGDALCEVVWEVLEGLGDLERRLALLVLGGETVIDSAKSLGIGRERASNLLNRRIRPVLREAASGLLAEYLGALDEELVMPARPKSSDQGGQGDVNGQ